MMLKNVLVLVLLIVVAKAFGAEPTMLPVLNTNGWSVPNSAIMVKVSFKAHNLSNPGCVNRISTSTGSYNHPHFYKVRATTLSDYYGYYSVDLDLEKRLIEAIGDSPKPIANVYEYFNECDFRISQVEVACEDGLLVIRQGSFHTFPDFRIKRGRTKSVYYNFDTNEEHLQIRVTFEE